MPETWEYQFSCICSDFKMRGVSIKRVEKNRYEVYRISPKSTPQTFNTPSMAIHYAFTLITQLTIDTSLQEIGLTWLAQMGDDIEDVLEAVYFAVKGSGHANLLPLFGEFMQAVENNKDNTRPDPLPEVDSAGKRHGES